jgi:vacuolar-type H+-ATPase subunit F/Vma7
VGTIVVLGEEGRIAAFALGGATVTPAEDPEAVRRAWDALPDDVSLVVLTERAAAALRGERLSHEALRVVMPS